MTSSMVSNPVVNSDRSLIRRKKKKKIQIQSQSQSIGESLGDGYNFSHNSSVQWKSDALQQIYSSKLRQALRQVHLRDSSGQASTPNRSLAVREAANRVLAATAKGRSRWSRAILTNRLKLKFLRKNNTITKQRRKDAVLTTGNDRWQRKSKVSVVRLKSKSLPAVQRKTRFLGRLVPGCRKQPLPVVLEEVIDYIPALEMQVRAMSALAELLSAPGSSALGGTAVNNFGSSRPPTTY